MKKRTSTSTFVFQRLLGTLLLLSIIGCTEPYALQTRNFESALVIEASISNELKQHSIKISRTYRLGESGPTFENGANVYVQDDLGNTFDFEQQDTLYVSENAFAPNPERAYTLHIVTSDGTSYSSTPEKQTTPTPIESLTAVASNLGELPAIQIRINTSDPTGNSRYYRYEYEEAGRFKVPHWRNKYLAVYPDNDDDDTFPELLLMDRTEEAETCYKKGRSKSIILVSTVGLAEDRIIDYPIRTIADTAYLINERYGIKVRQYVQNLASYTFYKTMSELSSTGNLLSQLQPGFFYGNIRSDGNPNEKVIGFFEVSAVDEKVVMFNYGNFFPGQLPPAFPSECKFDTYIQDVLEPGQFLGLQLIERVQENAVNYYETDTQGNYVVVTSKCGDCRLSGSNITPPWWQN
ncbi:DUF4249 domain-containing protein [Flavobacterium sp.]|uniref:DUF4249 domain-containing protein n=1 Tax=Flavobacterium sp. TaxID=239 RepID=UPI0025C261A7|nr:DUF4249 domain-containing protein [Flavobacterium sp.]